MEIRNVSEVDLMNALLAVNARYDGNIRFKNIRLLRKTTRIGKGEVWQLTLTVHATARKIVDQITPRRVHVETLPGVKVRPAYGFCAWGQSYEKGSKRRAAACWHVYGYFVDALPADCVIYTDVRTITGRPAQRKPGEPWYDFQAGPEAAPFLASECCECSG
jgi:hypothetical protein